MRVIIAGGRNYHFTVKDFDRLYELAASLSNLGVEITEILSGGATGADRGGQDWSRMRGDEPTVFVAHWSRFGKSAGPRRNQKMAEYAEAVILFPGGKGTENMFQEAKIRRLKIYDWRNNGTNTD